MTIAREIDEPVLFARAALEHARPLTVGVVDAAMVRMLEEALEAEIARAICLGGRDRKTGAIAATSPAIGHHLSTCLKTGASCSDRPPPRA